MSGDIPSLPPYAFMTCTRTTLPFTLHIFTEALLLTTSACLASPCIKLDRMKSLGRGGRTLLKWTSQKQSKRKWTYLIQNKVHGQYTGGLWQTQQEMFVFHERWRISGLVECHLLKQKFIP
jgi:hypothetical protein